MTHLIRWIVVADSTDKPFVTDWMVGIAIFAIIWIALAVALARAVHRTATRRHQPAGLWMWLTLIFSVGGYVGYRIYDDCESRQTDRVLAPAFAIATTFWLIGWLPLLIIVAAMSLTLMVSDLGIVASFFLLILIFTVPSAVFAFVYLLVRPRLTIPMIRARLAGHDELVDMGGKLLIVRDVVKYFPVRRGVFGRVWNHVKAVDGVTFALEKGHTLGLVGESGCGKTTTGRLILSLLEPTSGSVYFDGIDLSLLSPGELRAMRREMQLIFQDPFGSLNPRMTVLGIVGEALGIHGIARGKVREEQVAQLLERVGLDRRHIRRYPHEFSGGQRQRIGIARALALRPQFIVCDEPVSALDVSIQAQIINLLSDLQNDFDLTYLFIAHDLSVVEHVSDDVAVMYLGKIVEKAPGPDIYRNPLHPYTMALLSAVPQTDPAAKKEEIILEGDVPSPLNPPVGCRFHTRCRYMQERCKAAVPELREIEPGHFTACIRAEEIQAELKSG